MPILHYVSYLKNNHPHLKEAQTAENPADDRRSAQRCWAKVCRDVSVGVRPKSVEKKQDCLKYQQLLPFSLASSPKTEGKVIPCQWCVGWMLVWRASIHQIWQFQHYFTHPQLACALLFKTTYLCICLRMHYIPRYSSVSVYFLGPCREVAPLGLELQSRSGDRWQCCGYRTHNQKEKFCCRPEISTVRVERNSQGYSFSSAGFCPCAGMRRSHRCRAENMTVEIDAVFWEQNVPVCLACDPLCHSLTLWLSLVNRSCKKYICVLPPKSKEVASPAQREGICEMPTLSNAPYLEL